MSHISVYLPWKCPGRPRADATTAKITKIACKIQRGELFHVWIKVLFNYDFFFCKHYFHFRTYKNGFHFIFLLVIFVSNWNSSWNRLRSFFKINWCVVPSRWLLLYSQSSQLNAMKSHPQSVLHARAHPSKGESSRKRCAEHRNESSENPLWVGNYARKSYYCNVHAIKYKSISINWIIQRLCMASNLCAQRVQAFNSTEIAFVIYISSVVLYTSQNRPHVSDTMTVWWQWKKPKMEDRPKLEYPADSK